MQIGPKNEPKTNPIFSKGSGAHAELAQAPRVDGFGVTEIYSTSNGAVRPAW